MKCPYKHTEYQPENWRCPKCGAEAIFRGDDGFVIDASIGMDEESGWDDLSNCDKLHVEDRCKCYVCGYEASGRAVANRLKKQDNMMTCSHCKGSGVVPKEGGNS